MNERRHQRAIFNAQGRRMRRATMFSAMHPSARADFERLARKYGVSRSWLAAFMIEVFMYGEGETYAEDPQYRQDEEVTA